MTDLSTAWRPFEVSREALTKRFFEADNGSTWSVVARDREHAIKLLVEAQADWEGYVDGGLVTLPFDQALARGEAELDEMTPSQVARKLRCHTEDERGCIPLSEAAIGDLFCSDW
jgi:hypothetical protein